MRDRGDAKERYEQALAEVLEIKRTLAERARHVAELEERLMRQVEEGASKSIARRREPSAPAPRPEPTESDLARAVAAAEAEKALAQAERERLEERERHIRNVERELAGLRMELEQKAQRLAGRAAAESGPASPAAAQARAARRATKPQ